MGLIDINLINLTPILGLRKKRNEKLDDKAKERRKELYVDLARIIKMFPERTPTEILSSCGSDVPCFSGEYSTTINSLNNNIDDAVMRLGYAVDNRHKYEIETDIANWRYAIRELKKVEEAFEKSSTLYGQYRNEYSGEIELLFSQEVLNTIVSFEVFLNNAYGAPGLPVEPDEVQIIKDRIIFAMRNDIGTL